MSDSQEPVTLELAPLPREQIGPFLLLGVDKDASQEEIEASWAERVVRARKNLLRTPLADINWAREVISDPERRAQADVVSLNVDTSAAVLAHVARRYGKVPGAKPAWQPLEPHDSPEDYLPPTQVPDMKELAKNITLPTLAEEAPAVRSLLEQFLQKPIDPWALDFALEFRQENAV